MAEIFFISDTHFFHDNIYKKFKLPDGAPARPFPSAYDGDHLMLKNWNARVRPQDKVYHLGDVTFRYDGVFNELMSCLHGHKRLILGNHDKLGNGSLQRWFEKIDLWTGGKFKKYGFVASHIPLRRDQFRSGEFNVHGHTHHNLLKEPGYVNVCVEHTNYTPVHIDELIALGKSQL